MGNWSKLSIDGLHVSLYVLFRMSGTIPTESSKASTIADDMKITNYNELVELKVEENLEDQANPLKLKKKKLTSDA